MAKRGRKKKVSTPDPKVKKVKDERGELIKKILADPRLPSKKEWEFPDGETRDLQRNYAGIVKDYGVEMAKLGVGMDGLMRAKDEGKG